MTLGRKDHKDLIERHPLNLGKVNWTFNGVRKLTQSAKKPLRNYELCNSTPLFVCVSDFYLVCFYS